MRKTPFEQMRELMARIVEVHYSDLELERALCNTLLETAEREGYTYGVAYAHTYLGDYYIAKNDSARCGEELHLAVSLCTQNGFHDLLLRVRNLFGICYESLSDEQSALRQYMSALDLLELYPDPEMECAILNNIASDFEMRHDYQEALKYYTRAEQALSFCKDRPHYLYLQLRFGANLAESLIALGQLEEGLRYIELCAQMETSELQAQNYLVRRGWCNYWAAKGNGEQTAYYAQPLLECDADGMQDKYLAFEVLISICKALIATGNQTSSQLCLARLLNMCTGEEAERMEQIRKLKVMYSEAVGTEEERHQAYMQYYRGAAETTDRIDQVRAEGMKATLQLHAALREKDAAMLGLLRLEDEAHLDELTALYNRRYFNKLVTKASIEPNTTNIGFIMLDVDYFKEFNDTYGHSAGDQLLQQLARLLKACASEHIIPARYGGDEFVCLCVSKTDKEIEAFIHALRDGLALADIAHGTSRCAQRVTLSIGFHNALFRQYMETDPLLDKADQALYRAKSAGRNSWCK